MYTKKPSANILASLKLLPPKVELPSIMLCDIFHYFTAVISSFAGINNFFSSLRIIQCFYCKFKF